MCFQRFTSMLMDVRMALMFFFDLHRGLSIELRTDLVDFRSNVSNPRGEFVRRDFRHSTNDLAEEMNEKIHGERRTLCLENIGEKFSDEKFLNHDALTCQSFD